MPDESISLPIGGYNPTTQAWRYMDTPTEDVQRDTITLATFNIWFGEHYAEARYDAISDLLEPHLPDFIAFQEVIPKSLQQFLSKPWIRENYTVSDINGSTLDDYGVVLFSRIPSTAMKLLHLPSFMGRNLLLVETVVNGSPLTIATAHLESMKRSAEMRGSQLKRTFDYLKSSENVVIMGDFNFCSSWEEENDRIDLSYHDVWSLIHDDDPGYTEDTSINLMRYMLKGKHKRVRFDRILLKGTNWRPTAIELLGTQPIAHDHPDVYPSDHFGLLCRMVKHRSD